MSDYRTGLIAEQRPGDNLPVVSVSELSQEVKRTVEGRFERVRVRGEISGFKRAASGHLYMALKDADAVLDGVCWRGAAGRLAIAPEDGLEVVASGRITTYPGRSKYQIVIDSLELAGEGALLKLLEERRRRLEAEGLFEPARKVRLPYLPEVIGVVTSPTGAVLRDIRHRLGERFPRHILLWPVLVQGDTAAEQIAAAIRGFNALSEGSAVPRPDLLIVARGGGSLEDLWAFNEEVVVRAAAESEIPLISAVGHETDTTLIDFAADVRAPTPSAAAEMAVPVRAELLAQVLDLAGRTVGATGRLLAERANRVEGLARGLPDPVRLLEEKTQRLDDRVERLARAAKVWLQGKGREVAEAAAMIPRPDQQLAFSGREVAGHLVRLERLRGHLVETARERLAGLDAGRRIVNGVTQARRRAGQDLEGHTRALTGLRRRLGEPARRDFAEADAARRLRAAWRQRLKDSDAALDGLARLLESTSYRKVLARGFAVVRGPEGIVTGAGGVLPGLALEIEFADGTAPAVGGGGGGAPRKAPTRQAPGRQAPGRKAGSRSDDEPDGEDQGRLL